MTSYPFQIYHNSNNLYHRLTLSWRTLEYLLSLEAHLQISLSNSALWVRVTWYWTQSATQAHANRHSPNRKELWVVFNAWSKAWCLDQANALIREEVKASSHESLARQIRPAMEPFTQTMPLIQVCTIFSNLVLVSNNLTTLPPQSTPVTMQPNYLYSNKDHLGISKFYKHRLR